jgi:hypothetical protein
MIRVAQKREVFFPQSKVVAVVVVLYHPWPFGQTLASMLFLFIVQLTVLVSQLEKSNRSRTKQVV